MVGCLGSLPHNYRAVVIGSDGGIGGALCELVRKDCRLGEIVKLSRRNGLNIADEESVASCATQLGDRPIHLLICATGILTAEGKAPEKSLRQLDANVMMAQFLTNAVGPALVAKHFLPRLDRRERSIAAFLSARVGSIGDNRLGGWISYRSAKAALNQIVRTASIEVARTHPQALVVSIHPGTVRTRLSEPYAMGHPTVSPAEAAASILLTVDSMSPERTGSFVAYDGSTILW
jgi:NAD(P)-dependent dehydrogenase (short-subunit alcohol dehydrogenase family)